MATPSQGEIHPYQAGLVDYTRRYWKKAIADEGDTLLAAFNQFVQRYETSMSDISSQIRTHVTDPALASQIIDENVPNFHTFLTVYMDRMEPTPRPQAGAPLPVETQHPNTALEAAAGSSKDDPTKAMDLPGRRASNQTPLDSSPTTWITRNSYGTTASTQNRPDLRAANRASVKDPNPVPSNIPPATQPDAPRQPIKRRRTQPTDSFIPWHPPSAPKPTPNPTPNPTPPSRLLHWLDVKNRAYMFLHTDGHYYATVCFGVHGGGRHWFRTDPLPAAGAAHFRRQNLSVVAANRCHYERDCAETLDRDELIRKIAWRVVMKYEMETEDGRKRNADAVRGSNQQAATKAEGLAMGSQM